MTGRLLLAALLLAPAARAAVIASGDYGGANIVVSSGDVLSGVYTNVGLFSVPSGVTGTVAALVSGPNLVVYASTVSIAGVLDGVGHGQPGGGGGQAPSGAGSAGTGGGPGSSGNGAGGAAAKGGGGGAGGGAGGQGGGDSGGGFGAAGGAGYGSTGTITSPISADDLYQGSGGGGGGANTTVTGGSGAPGGAAIYIEAASMTVTGMILVDGSTASAVAFIGSGVHPAAGGGGGGGSILLRVTGQLALSNGAKLSANGNGGGNVDDGSFHRTDEGPGGGGGGGRIKLFFGSSAFGSVDLSTAGGVAGSTDTGFLGSADTTTPAAIGAAGSVSVGVIAATPSAFNVSSVHVSSISWTWNASSSFGDAPAGSQLYRVFPGTATAPLTTPQTTASSLALGTTEQSLTPNTTYFRFVTAFTDWGDSFPSNSVSTHTLAADPAPGATPFSSMASTSLSFSWTAGSPSNPSYTVYELDASTSSVFAAPVSTGFTTSVSSSPANLSPNTTYFFRVRAVNLDGVPTAYTATQATATLAAQPGNPVVGPVFITSGVYTWSAAGNPPDTQYLAQISTDGFVTVADSSATLSASATFFTLTPGTVYFWHVQAINRNSVANSFVPAIPSSATAGNLSNTSAPSAPGAPVADRSFSADGTAVFAWAPASSSVGILDYNLIVGSLPGGSDLFAGNVTVSSYAASGMGTGKTYYAQVRARSNAGVYSLFSSVSQGLPVFIPAQTAPIAKPFNWPNPFDPSKGPTQIGFHLDEAADVTLKMYNLQGRFVSKTTASFPAGNQIMTWNGANDGGMRVTPGGYIGVIEKHYGGRTDTQRIKIAVLY